MQNNVVIVERASAGWITQFTIKTITGKEHPAVWSKHTKKKRSLPHTKERERRRTQHTRSQPRDRVECVCQGCWRSGEERPPVKRAADCRVSVPGAFKAAPPETTCPVTEARRRPLARGLQRGVKSGGRGLGHSPMDSLMAVMRCGALCSASQCPLTEVRTALLRLHLHTDSDDQPRRLSFFFSLSRLVLLSSLSLRSRLGHTREPPPSPPPN